MFSKGVSSNSVSEFIKQEVHDWDDEVIATARFRALSGQRSDWESRYGFWRNLILKVARHFGLLIVHPAQVKNEWFNRAGLTPLCLDHVLFIMYNEGDIVRREDLGDTTSGRLSVLFRKLRSLMVGSAATPELLKDHVIFTTLLKDKAAEVVKLLSENHWTSSCIITMTKFQDICEGPDEASAVLSYLSGCGKARYLSINKKEFIEGVKVCLSSTAVSSISCLDYDVLHLIWTMERLQQQYDVIDGHYEMSRKLALASLESGNKTIALRHARKMRLARQNREKCTSLLNRVEQVLGVIADAECTKKVSEAIKIGAQALKNNTIHLEEVQICLEELDESIDLQKQVERVLEPSPSYFDIADEDDIEEEIEKLELELESENPKTRANSAATESNESLAAAFSSLGLESDPSRAYASQDSAGAIGINEEKRAMLEDV